MGIDIDELKSFVYAAQEGSFSAAARELGRAQSVISTHIANMEAELGYRLFVRSHRPILTEQGEQLLPYAKHVINEYARFDIRTKQIYGDVPLSLHIGLDHSLGNNAIMGLFEKLSLAHPQLRVQIESLNAFDVNWFSKTPKWPWPSCFPMPLSLNALLLKLHSSRYQSLQDFNTHCKLNNPQRLKI